MDKVKLYNQAEAARMRSSVTRAMDDNFIENTKDNAKKNGTFKVVASTNKKNKNGYIMSQEGADHGDWLKSPVILFNHARDDGNDLPIGVGTKIYVENVAKDQVGDDTKDYTKQTVIEGVFAGSERAQQVRELYDMGLSATSVGGMPTKVGEFNEDGSVPIENWSLEELSFCNVPADPDCVAVLNKKGADIKSMKENGIISETIQKPGVENKDDEKKNVTMTDEKLKEFIGSAVREEIAKNNTPLVNERDVKDTQEFIKNQAVRRIQQCASMLNCVLRDIKLQK